MGTQEAKNRTEKQMNKGTEKNRKIATKEQKNRGKREKKEKEKNKGRKNRGKEE